MTAFWDRTLMTMHGTTMIFFAAMPILAGVANYIVPLQIGARDMAFPRLNALGLWVTLNAVKDFREVICGFWLVCRAPNYRR
jgi:heme/copper-type cytochrome/quinol oxidase subunit 1